MLEDMCVAVAELGTVSFQVKLLKYLCANNKKRAKYTACIYVVEKNIEKKFKK